MLVTRRHLVVGAAAVASFSAAKAQKLVATSAQDLGPFYPIIQPADHDADLTRLKGREGTAKGKPINVIGRVVDLHGNPIGNARSSFGSAIRRVATIIPATVPIRRHSTPISRASPVSPLTAKANSSSDP